MEYNSGSNRASNFNYERDYPELYDTKSYYQLIASIKKIEIGKSLQFENLFCVKKIIGLFSRLYKQQENSKKEPILACVMDAQMA